MNYRHAYHAGNFADVLKHIVLTRIIEYLKRKDKAFRVIDTHAGVGLYDLSSDEAQRGGEWQDGIGRIIGAELPGDVAALLRPWLDAVRALNSGTGPDAALARYPGSPLLARQLLRKQDRLTAIELHPADARALGNRFAGDFQVKVIELDGWLALGAQLPPKEKRGLVLVDPPFEKPGEFERLTDGLARAHRRWPGGTYALWYPIKDRRAVKAFRRQLGDLAIPSIIDITLEIHAQSADRRLDGCGMIIVNPPYPLTTECAAFLPVIGRLLAEDGVSRAGVELIAGEQL